jgi:hypothetical protein
MNVVERLFQSACGVQVGVATTLAETQALISLFEQVAAEEGWHAGDQLRAFTQSAVYFCLHLRGELCGGLHLVRPSALGRLPGHAVWPELPPAEENAAHIVVLALKRECRGSPETFWTFCAEMWRFAWQHRITELRLEVTPQVKRIYRRLGWPLEDIGEPREHWGEVCVPVKFDVCAAASEVVRRAERSELYRTVAAQLFRPIGATQLTR